MRIHLKIIIISSMILIINNIFTYAEENQEGKPDFSGSLSFGADLYSMDSDGSIMARRPNSLYRFIANTNLQYKKFSMPFSLMLSSNQTNFTTPRAPDQDIWQYLQNPMNRLSIAPKYDWAQLRLGHHIPDYSDLSTGNTPVFGGGFELTPGDFLIAGYYGSIQRAIEPDSNKNIAGAYSRSIYTLRFAYGSKGGFQAGINFVNMEDDTSSIDDRPRGRYPEAGKLMSLDFRIPIISNLTFFGEAGACFFTRNQYSEEIENEELDFLPDFLMPRYSSRLDYAGKAGVRLAFDNWGADVSALYVGDGYVPLGYRFFQSDRLEYTIAPYLNLLENKLMIRGSIGQRFNNLQDTKSETSSQLIASLNATFMITESFSVNADFSNYGIRNNVDNDTLKVEMVSRAFSLMPNYTIRSEFASHNIMAMYSQDDFTDFNTFTGESRSNITQTFMGGYTIRFNNIPMSSTLSFNHIQNDLRQGELSMTTMNIGMDYRFLENKLTPAVRFTYTLSSIGDNTEDRQLKVRLSAKYKITKSLSARMSAYINNYDYGSQRQGVSFSESFMQMMISYRF